MRLVEYKCEKCDKVFEEIFYTTDVVPETLPCPECKQEAKKTWNIKNNAHRVRIQDK